MGFSQLPAAFADTGPQTYPIFGSAPPADLTLQATYTSSTAGLSFPVEWIYVVAVGGGGSGSSASAMSGGGGGACVQGWIRTTGLTSVTVGSGGASVTGTGDGNPGGATIVGPLYAYGGGRASTTSQNIRNGIGAGMGGLNGTFNARAESDNTAYGRFVGGAYGNSGTSGGGGVTSSFPPGAGLSGPGGGAGQTNAGGSSISPNGTTYSGGTGNGSGGGGGAGVLANGGNGSASGGGTGGSGGGGGGGCIAAIPSGAGGNGCVLIYY